MMKLIPVDPINFSLKGKLLSVVSCFGVIWIVAWLTQFFSQPSENPILIASMGASAVILIVMPSSPLAQPWPLVGGQLVSTFIGVFCAQTIPDIALASAFAVGGSVLAMLLLRCLHPPGAASALAPILSGNSISALGYGFVLLPVGFNVTVMLAMTMVINRWLLRYDYPVKAWRSPITQRKDEMAIPNQPNGISGLDVEKALQSRDTFMDVSVEAVSQLLIEIQQQHFEQLSGAMTCADLMVSNVLSVEYGTEVETAWKIMQENNLRALPVIDRAKRVIGIVTRYDFVSSITLNPPELLHEKFRAFIRRTPDTSTHKPEAIGHIMSKSVATLKENTPIASLIPLMANLHQQIPIVNIENRLVGMVYQADLISALAKFCYTVNINTK